MKIAGIEYDFAYTIGVACALSDLYPDGAPANQGRYIVDTAILMSDAYESRCAMNDPTYTKKKLTKEVLMSLDAADLGELTRETNKAYRKGTKRTVETETVKKTEKTAK